MMIDLLRWRNRGGLGGSARRRFMETVAVEGRRRMIGCFHGAFTRMTQIGTEISYFI
ncbi:hypothetical protein Hanom_Chr08g00697691 [Helianthus anomalus]